MLIGDQSYIAIKHRRCCGDPTKSRLTENVATHRIQARLEYTDQERAVLYWENVAVAPHMYPGESQRPKRRLAGAALVKYIGKRVGCDGHKVVELRQSALRVMLNVAYAESVL